MNCLICHKKVSIVDNRIFLCNEENIPHVYIQRIDNEIIYYSICYKRFSSYSDEIIIDTIESNSYWNTTRLQQSKFDKKRIALHLGPTTKTVLTTNIFFPINSIEDIPDIVYRLLKLKSFS